MIYLFFFVKQKTAYEMRISDWSSDVCSSDLLALSLNTAAGKALKASGATPEALNTAINALRGGRSADTASAEDRYDALKKFARDLTEDARSGRSEEHTSELQSLMRISYAVFCLTQKTARTIR